MKTYFAYTINYYNKYDITLHQFFLYIFQRYGAQKKVFSFVNCWQGSGSYVIVKKTKETDSSTAAVDESVRSGGSYV